MQRWHAKVICGVIMFVLMPVCFLLPLRMVSLFGRWGSRGQEFLDLLSCFAGGVFLASYLVFMAPAVRVLIETNLMQPYNIEFPLPDTIIGLGFFMMLAINYTVRAINKCSSKTSRPSRRHRQSAGSKTRHESGRSEVFYGEPAAAAESGDVSSSKEHQALNCDVTADVADREPTVNNNVGNGRGPSAPTSLSRQTSLSMAGSYYIDVYRSPRTGGSKRNSIVELAIAGAGGQSLVRSVVMMLALSVDSVLEGMTIGLKQTVVEVWAIFVGIVVHESVIAFCLGLQLVRLNAGRCGPVVAAAVVYTLMNPIGVVVATSVYETCESDPRVDLANGVLQALTSGCFIYVIFYEILDGLITDNTPLARILAVFVGYAFLASFAAIPGSGPYHTVSCSTSPQS
jgi:zinc transporter ZupT